MAALTKDRNTRRRNGTSYSYPMTAAVTAFAGGIAVLDAAGNCRPGHVAATLTAVGRFAEHADNSAGAAAAKSVIVEPGIFRWQNSSAGDLITKADIGALCYIVDDQTVAKTDATAARSAAGRVVDVDAQGVWVKIGI